MPRRGPSNRAFGARHVQLDLGAAEWDWITEQAIAMGIPLARRVRDLLALAEPIAKDPLLFDAQRHALFEMRQAVYGCMRDVFMETTRRFIADPEAFIPANHRANMNTLASNPIFDEPDDLGRLK